VGTRDDARALGETRIAHPMATLLIVGAGIVHEVSPDGLTIGRDPDCAIVLDSPEVSRHHATVAAATGGFVITDESTNGVFVNGERVAQSHRLADGDVIRVGDAILRFSAGGVTRAGSAIPTALSGETIAMSDPGIDDDTSTMPVPKFRAPQLPPSMLLATLDVVEGNVPHGMRFRIERSVAQLGRGAASDVCLLDQSVSGAHATLMLRRGTWYLLDHSSANGTYVDGTRVNQCALPGPCDLRLGAVTLRFRPVQPQER
jgi:pSer/pThr/pTyr-binding forkhead associated (FHA) protein